MTPLTARRIDLPAVSQPMPLNDFPAFNPRATETRPLSEAEAAELVLRERVRAYRRAHPLRRGFTRVAFAAVLSVFCLPTVERLVLHHVDLFSALASLV